MTSRLARASHDAVLGGAVGVLGALYVASIATRPVIDGRAGPGIALSTGALLLAHVGAYLSGAQLRRKLGIATYLGLQGALLVAVGFMHPPLLFVLALYGAITAQAVSLPSARFSAMPVFLVAVPAIALSTALSSGVYRGATIAAILAAAGLFAYAIAAVSRATSRDDGEAAPVVAVSGAALTSRELEVLRLAAAGQRSKQIAAKLAISERTVKAHLAHVYQKLGADSRAAAVAIAVRRGLLG